MKLIKLKTKKVKTPKVQFSIFDTHWIDLEFINHEGFSHRKLRDFTLEEMPFISVGIYAFYVMWDTNQNAIRVMHNRINDDALLCLVDVAFYLGYRDLNDMMADDNILDSCNIIQKLTGVFPIEKIIIKPIL